MKEKEKEKKEEKLWKIKIGEEEGFFQFYLISTQEPVFVSETTFGKFQRRFGSLSLLGSPRMENSLSLPIFYIRKKQKATVEEVQDISGFNLQKLTPQHIILSVENPHQKSLYELALFHKNIRAFFKKKYVLASDKKEAIQYSNKFKSLYTIKATKAKKVYCYPIVTLTKDILTLNREKKTYRR